MKKLGQKSAFPIDVCNDGHHSLDEGMNKRFYAACAAMQGILANAAHSEIYHVNDWGVDGGRIAQNAWHCADELLKQESEINEKI